MDAGFDISHSKRLSKEHGEGHAFGSHTWRHWYFRGERDGKVRYVPWGGKEQETLKAHQQRQTDRLLARLVR